MGDGETRRSDEDRKRTNQDGDDKNEHEIREDQLNVGPETETKTLCLVLS